MVEMWSWQHAMIFWGIVCYRLDNAWWKIMVEMWSWQHAMIFWGIVCYRLDNALYRGASTTAGKAPYNGTMTMAAVSMSCCAEPTDTAQAQDELERYWHTVLQESRLINKLINENLLGILMINRSENGQWPPAKLCSASQTSPTPSLWYTHTCSSSHTSTPPQPLPYGTHIPTPHPTPPPTPSLWYTHTYSSSHTSPNPFPMVHTYLLVIPHLHTSPTPFPMVHTYLLLHCEHPTPPHDTERSRC